MKISEGVQTMTYPRGLEPGRIPTFDNVLPSHVVEALAGGGYACQNGDTPWFTLSGKRWSGAQRLDPAVVEALVEEGHVEILTRDQLPHLGNAKSVQLTDTGREWHAAMQVEHALRNMDQDCAECLGTGYHRYDDHKDGTPNFSDSAPCPGCRGTGRRWPRPCPGCGGTGRRSGNGPNITVSCWSCAGSGKAKKKRGTVEGYGSR